MRDSWFHGVGLRRNGDRGAEAQAILVRRRARGGGGGVRGRFLMTRAECMPPIKSGGSGRVDLFRLSAGIPKPIRKSVANPRILGVRKIRNDKGSTSFGLLALHH